MNPEVNKSVNFIVDTSTMDHIPEHLHPEIIARVQFATTWIWGDFRTGSPEEMYVPYSIEVRVETGSAIDLEEWDRLRPYAIPINENYRSWEEPEGKFLTRPRYATVDCCWDEEAWSYICRNTVDGSFEHWI